MPILPKLRGAFSAMRRHPWRSLFALSAIAVATPVLCDVRVAFAARGRVHAATEDVTETPVALLLGTAKIYNGRPNAFYTARIRAAAELFQSGKIRGILVSGDNGRHGYNEPEDMRDDLIRAGVPADFITLDYAGFRTLDSVVRAKDVFGQDRVVVVSQKFHVQRAIYLARQHGIDATGYVADDPPLRSSRMKVRAREVFVRSAAVLDSWIGREPKYRGKKETVSLRG